MANDVEEEFPVAPGVGQLAWRWPAQWESAEDEWSGLEGEFLFAIVALLADQTALMCHSWRFVTLRAGEQSRITDEMGVKRVCQSTAEITAF